VADLVDGFVRHAKEFAVGIDSIDGARVENDVVFSQVSASFGSDENTAEVTRRLMADGTAWMTGSRWNGKAVLRISVSNWSTTDEDLARSLEALRRAAHP
jgi:glutamate/tyrosine decarboxylase-like PLP-dependent enzyme